MKLGMSQACYRWIAYPSLRRDDLEYRRSGRPLPYLSTVRPPREGESEVAWLLEKISELGLDALYVHARLLVDKAGAEAFKAEMADRSVEHIGGIGFNVASDESEWESGGFENAAEEIQILGWSGARIAAAVHNEPTRHNHFSQDPPVDVQIERAIANFRSLMPVCEKHGVVLAFENHLDYRISEIVQVVEAVDSPWLRINFDTANPISVIEDPMDAARMAAKVHRDVAPQGHARAAGHGHRRAARLLGAARPRRRADRRDSRALPCGGAGPVELRRLH